MRSLQPAFVQTFPKIIRPPKSDRLLADFLGPAPHAGPCQTLELGAFLGDRLLAASYLDVGATGVSSIYAFFDPEESRRSLGTATMIWEILLARRTGRRWHYPGYAYVEPSGYDYKKQFGPMECFDWDAWRPLAGAGAGSE